MWGASTARAAAARCCWTGSPCAPASCPPSPPVPGPGSRVPRRGCGPTIQGKEAPTPPRGNGHEWTRDYGLRTRDRWQVDRPRGAPRGGSAGPRGPRHLRGRRAPAADAGGRLRPQPPRPRPTRSGGRGTGPPAPRGGGRAHRGRGRPALHPLARHPPPLPGDEERPPVPPGPRPRPLRRRARGGRGRPDPGRGRRRLRPGCGGVRAAARPAGRGGGPAAGRPPHPRRAGGQPHPAGRLPRGRRGGGLPRGGPRLPRDLPVRPPHRRQPRAPFAPGPLRTGHAKPRPVDLHPSPPS